MARQQQVIEALRDKVIKLNLLSDLPTFLEMEKILSSYFETNISKEEGARALELAKNLTQEDITYKVIDPSTGLITSGSVNFGGTNAFVLWPKAGQFNYSEIQKYIKSLIDPEPIQK
jgi:anionic cell wall polymer biosynthesis LytR-Cps2A-Psr (LCP) family protein